MVVNNILGIRILLAAGQGMNSGPLLRVTAKLLDDLTTENACKDGKPRDMNDFPKDLPVAPVTIAEGMLAMS